MMAEPVDEIPDTIELRTNCSAHVLRLARIEKSKDGGYACDLTVVPGGFSCDRQFGFDEDFLNDALEKLKEMSSGRPETAKLRYRYETDELQFRSNDMGHVFVSGDLVEHSDLPQRLHFEFRTDQTVLGPLIRDLQALKDRPPDCASDG
jgi:hypothetical protein